MTVTSPVMPGWIWQKYVNVPVRSSVTSAVAPAPASRSSNAPSGVGDSFWETPGVPCTPGVPDVTVCVMSSWFVQVTTVPTGTDREWGEKEKEWIETAVAPDWVALELVFVQLIAITASRQQAAKNALVIKGCFPVT